MKGMHGILFVLEKVQFRLIRLGICDLVQILGQYDTNISFCRISK